MGILDSLRRKAGSQFIEIIEWLDETPDSLVYRFPVKDQEIKMGARLTVRENQLALFVNEGKAADLLGPGLHELTTRNVPVLTMLRGWKHGFQSPFKAEVYFFSTRLFADLKWGTAQPIMMRGAQLGMIRLRAFGTFATRLADARTFFSTLVGTRGLTSMEQITGQLRSIILTRFSDAAAESGISALDLAAHSDELSELGRARIGPDFLSLGLELSRFFVENLSLPEGVQAAIDQSTRLTVLEGRLAELAQLQAAEAMTMAAGAEGGAAGAGMSLGAGMALGQAMGQAMAHPPRTRPTLVPIAPTPAPDVAHAPRWSLSIGGRNYGPYSEHDLRGMVLQGKLASDCLAWKPGASGWASLDTYPEFSDLVPPPSPAD